MRLTVEIEKVAKGETPGTVEFYFDKEGLDTLLRRIELIRTGKTDHVHLFTPLWGTDDDDLSEEKLLKKNDLAHHLKLTMIDSSEE
jgi:hypothetical protein